jgi:hypothetical protein
MANVSLTNLIAKIRKLTARPSSNQISDASIVDYINLFYQYDFPQALKIFDFHTTYTFYTQPNQDTYVLSQNDRNLYKSFEPPVFCSGYYINYYQNREQFYRMWPALFTNQTLTTSSSFTDTFTGVLNLGAVAYTNTYSHLPAPGSITITIVNPNTGVTLYTFVETAPGILSAGVGTAGTITYATGVFALTFPALPAPGGVLLYNVIATAQVSGGAFFATISGTPILAGSVLVSVVGPAGTTLIAQDVGTGALTGTFTGDVSAGCSINYITGDIYISWNAVPPAGNVITVKYTPYTASRPLGLLFYNNTFTLRPIPDQAYKIDLQTYIQPFAVAPVTDVPGEYAVASPNALPLLADYFQLLAYGAACKIFVDSLEMDNYRMILPLLQEQMSFAERKTMMQIKTQRTQTIYSENLYWNSNRLPTV